MTQQQMQAIAKKLYPITDSSTFSSIQQEAFLRGLTYSRWIAVEDGCAPIIERQIGWERHSVYVHGQGEYGHIYTCCYDFDTNTWLDQHSNIVSTPIAIHPLPSPYIKKEA
jgi:hypothetical protein